MPNSSFENYTSCPTSGDQLIYAPPWYSPTAGTTDYFNTCGSAGFQTPLNVWGYQFPKTGNAYAEIAVYGSGGTSIREYIQVQLTDTLIQDELYCISFYVSPAGMSSFFSSYTSIAITEIGLLLSNNPIITSDYLPLPYTPQIVSPVGVYLNDTTQWIKISDTYTALGGERYITIGNFKDDISTDTITVANSGFDPQGYYYVDDIAVIDCDSLVGINENTVEDSFSLFPNPNNGNMILSYSMESNDKAYFRIFDIIGKLVTETSLNPDNEQVQIKTDLRNGVYLYQIIINDRITKSDKILIK